MTMRELTAWKGHRRGELGDILVPPRAVAEVMKSKGMGKLLAKQALEVLPMSQRHHSSLGPTCRAGWDCL